jgi:hypothetical protein
MFSGPPESPDIYGLTSLKDAKQAFFARSAHSRVFRSFQGWTALTDAGPGEGSLMLYPNVKWVIAYVLLRPFFKAPESGEVPDPSRCTSTATLPGSPARGKTTAKCSLHRLIQISNYKSVWFRLLG